MSKSKEKKDYERHQGMDRVGTKPRLPDKPPAYIFDIAREIVRKMRKHRRHMPAMVVINLLWPEEALEKLRKRAKKKKEE